MENIEDRLLRFQLKKALLLKAIFHMEGTVSMKEMEEAMEVGNRVGEIINNMANGNFLSPPPQPQPQPQPKTEPKAEEPTINNDDLSNQLNSQIQALTGMLEQKQKEITHIYDSYGKMRAVVDSQIEVINSKTSEIGTMISTFQNDMYKIFTGKD